MKSMKVRFLRAGKIALNLHAPTLWDEAQRAVEEPPH